MSGDSSWKGIRKFIIIDCYFLDPSGEIFVWIDVAFATASDQAILIRTFFLVSLYTVLTTKPGYRSEWSLNEWWFAVECHLTSNN